jgi:hypothetical protein
MEEIGQMGCGMGKSTVSGRFCQRVNIKYRMARIKRTESGESAKSRNFHVPIKLTLMTLTSYQCQETIGGASIFNKNSIVRERPIIRAFSIYLSYVLDCGCSINPFHLPTNPIKTHFGALSNRLPVQIANDPSPNPTDSENLWGSQSIFAAMIQKSRSKSVQRTGVSIVVVALVIQSVGISLISTFMI